MNKSLIEESKFDDMTGYSCALYIFKYQNGIIEDPIRWLKQLKTYHSYQMLKKVGTNYCVPEKFNLEETACVVILYSKVSNSEIEEDRQKIFDLEHNNLFI